MAVALVSLNKFYLRARAQTAPPTAQLLLGPAKITAGMADTFTINLGADTPVAALGIDALLIFNSDLLEVVSVATGSSYLKTLVPGEANVLDLTRAVSVDNVNPSQSTLEFGLVAYDLGTNTPTSGISGVFDPATDPLVTITFRAKSEGPTQLKFKFISPGVTTDANVVVIIDGTPTDILVAPTAVVDVTVTGTCGIIFDFDNNRRIDIADIMLPASRWGARTGDSRYEARFDPDADRDIDVADVQQVASTWGRICQ